MNNSGRSRARVVRRLALGAVLALVGSVLFVGPASAHARLVRSDPADGAVLVRTPSVITFTFDEPIRSQSGGVRVFDAQGDEVVVTSRTVDARLVVALPARLDGSYVVAWRVVSTDGHPVADALTFSVGTPSTTLAPRGSVLQSAPTGVRTLLGVAQGATYLGVFGACGLVLFLMVLLPRAGGLDELRSRLARLASWFAVLVLGGGAALVPLTSLHQRAEGFSVLGSSGWWSDALESTEALSSLLVAAGALIAVSFVRSALDDFSHRIVALGGVLLALLSLSLVGHTRSESPVALMVAADLSHVVAGSVWFGGLIGLVITLRRLSDRPRIGAAVLGRFSAVAAWALAGVLVTGGVLAWRILGTWGNLFGTDFGRVLMVKVGVVLLVAALAGWNRYWLMPTMLADHGASTSSAATRMRRTVRTEAVLLVGVLTLTGFLVDRTPVRDSSPTAALMRLDSSTVIGRAGALRVVAMVKPAVIGKNSIRFDIVDDTGERVAPLARPTVSVALGDLALGDQTVTVISAGRYRADVLIPHAGKWTLSVSVRLSRFENPVVVMRVPVRS